PTFCAGCALTTGVVLYYTQLGVTPLWLVMAINGVLFVGITARMISAQALSSAIPAMTDRGAYMAISSSLQQLSGGTAAWGAGRVIAGAADGAIVHYERLGYVVAGTVAVTVGLMFRLNQMVMEQVPMGLAGAPEAPRSVPAE